MKKLGILITVLVMASMLLARDRYSSSSGTADINDTAYGTWMVDNITEVISMDKLHDKIESLDPNSHTAVTMDANAASVMDLTGQEIGVDLATPANGKTGYLSTADQIYDWVVGLLSDYLDIATYDTDADGYADPNYADFKTADEANEYVRGVIEADPNIVKQDSNGVPIFCFNIPEPNAALDIDIKMKYLSAYTITNVIGITVGGTNVVGRLYEVDADGSDADKVGIESSDWTFTSTETHDTSFNNATIDAGDYLQWDTTSVSGSVTMFTLIVYGIKT